MKIFVEYFNKIVDRFQIVEIIIEYIDTYTEV